MVVKGKNNLENTRQTSLPSSVTQKRTKDAREEEWLGEGQTSTMRSQRHMNSLRMLLL